MASPFLREQPLHAGRRFPWALGVNNMEELTYFSRNRKQPPFRVTVRVDGSLVYVQCDCPLGQDQKICRHKINAIRGDRQYMHESTSDQTVDRLRTFFGARSALRQHLEEKWRLLRIYAAENPDDVEQIEHKRWLLGQAFSNGFLNERLQHNGEPFDPEAWEQNREVVARGLSSRVVLKYEGGDGRLTDRTVDVTEIFWNDGGLYLMGYCHLRGNNRTFRTDRIQSIEFGEACSQAEKSALLDAIFQGSSNGQ